ncbi:tellurite resistance protein TerA [Streptacidiphilus sp. MAP12-20]|uniref:Tellurium resistance n=1 Tax=Streptacidiphilus sp. MAP12-20 TaxID=3156299 RepID=UPI003513C2DF
MAGLRDLLRKADRGLDIGIERVTLDKRRQSFSLTEQGALTGTMQVNLHWTTREPERPRRSAREQLRALLNPNPFRPVTLGQGATEPLAVDLDLGCMYELTDGTKGVIQPLGRYMGDLQHPPHIKLSGDDRSGAPTGEMIYIDMDKRDTFKRLLIFVYIYDETPAFDRTHAVVTLFPTAGPRIEVRLDERAAEARSCAVLLIENKGNGEFLVTRELRYVYGFQAELDRLYGWGLQWQRGFKPVGG